VKASEMRELNDDALLQELAQAKQALIQALELPEVTQSALDFDFGTLTQDVNAQFRARPVNSTPYVAK